MDRFINHRITDLVVMCLIVLSVVLIVIELALPVENPAFEPIEIAGHAITGIFVVELTLRWIAAPSTRRFLRNYWLDILAVLPLFRSFRMIRIIRLLRLFRIGILLNRRASGITGSLHNARLELATLLIVLVVVMVAGAIGIDIAESEAGTHGAGSLLHSIWWSAYSLVAGEVPDMPSSAAGKLISLAVMLCGIGFFATFTGIVSAAMVTRLRARMEAKEVILEEVENHLVVCGWNRMGYKLLEQVACDEQLCDRYVVVVTEAEAPPEPCPYPPQRLFFVSGDYTRPEVLEQAGIRRASIAVLLADKTKPRSDQDRDARTVLAAMAIERLNPAIFTCVELLSRDNQSHLQMVGVEEVLVPDEYAGKILATATRNRGIVAVLNELLTTDMGNNIYKAPLPAGWAGKNVDWAMGHMKKNYNATLLSVERGGEGSSGPQVMVNPNGETVLQAGDNLIFMATGMPDLK